MASGRRILQVLVGLALFTCYAVIAAVGFLWLGWLVANPPNLVPVALVVLLVVVGAGYAGYRVGTVRLVASLDARRLPRERAPAVYRRLQRLCADANAREPLLLVANLGAPNALSLGGPRRGVVVLDRRLFRLLTIDELEGILAHEIAHMERYHTFVNTLALTAARLLVVVVLVALFPVVVLVAGGDHAAGWLRGHPTTRRAGLVTRFRRVTVLLLGGVLGLVTVGFLAYSRRQEFAADRRAAALTGNPAALARALGKIHRATTPRRGLFSVLYTHDERETRDLFSTHPPVEERVERLLSMTDDAVANHYVGRIRP